MNNIFFITFSKYAFSVSSLLQNWLCLYNSPLTSPRRRHYLCRASVSSVLGIRRDDLGLSPVTSSYLPFVVDGCSLYFGRAPHILPTASLYLCTCNYKNKFNKYILIHVYTCICEFLDIQINFHLNIRQHTTYTLFLSSMLKIMHKFFRVSKFFGIITEFKIIINKVGRSDDNLPVVCTGGCCECLDPRGSTEAPAWPWLDRESQQTENPSLSGTPQSLYHPTSYMFPSFHIDSTFNGCIVAQIYVTC